MCYSLSNFIFRILRQSSQSRWESPHLTSDVFIRAALYNQEEKWVLVRYESPALFQMSALGWDDSSASQWLQRELNQQVQIRHFHCNAYGWMNTILNIFRCVTGPISLLICHFWTKQYVCPESESHLLPALQIWRYGMSSWSSALRVWYKWEDTILQVQTSNWIKSLGLKLCLLFPVRKSQRLLGFLKGTAVETARVCRRQCMSLWCPTSRFPQPFLSPPFCKIWALSEHLSPCLLLIPLLQPCNIFPKIDWGTNQGL